MFKLFFILVSLNHLSSTNMEDITLHVGRGHGRQGRLVLSTFGAHVTSWTTSENNGATWTEHLWMSTLSALDGSAPIRGGIPIAFPQFADSGPMKLHGFAREKIWSVIDRNSTEASDSVTLCLESDEDAQVQWKYDNDFQINVTVELSVSSLSMSLKVQNLSNTKDMQFTGCFHTYFKTQDIRQCYVSGLQGLTFIDKVDGYKEKNQCASSNLSISEEASQLEVMEGKYFIDRIYKNAEAANCLELIDHGAGLITKVEKSSSWPNWVVFNPWVEGKKGDRGPDFDDDGYNFMLCLEPAIAIAPVVLPPSNSWMGTQLITLTPIVLLAGIEK